MKELIKTNNLEMEFFKFGNGSKNMIIIPGVSSSSLMPLENAIKVQYKIFANDFKIYVFDRKKNMKEPYSIDDMANDMIEALEYLNLDNLYLFGTSQGGMIAMLIAIKRPDLIKKLNINSTTYKTNDKAYKLFNEIINYANNKDINKAIHLLFSHIYSNNFYNSIKDSLNPYTESLTDEDIKRFIIQCKALNNFNIENDLSKIKCETLIVCDKKDQIFDYNDSIFMNNKINNSQIFIYDKYGHVVYDEDKDFPKRVFDFFIINQQYIKIIE